MGLGCHIPAGVAWGRVGSIQKLFLGPVGWQVWGLQQEAQGELEPAAWGICMCDQGQLLLAVKWGFWGWRWHGLKPLVFLNGWVC